MQVKENILGAGNRQHTRRRTPRRQAGSTYNTTLSKKREFAAGSQLWQQMLMLPLLLLLLLHVLCVRYVGHVLHVASSALASGQI